MGLMDYDTIKGIKTTYNDFANFKQNIRNAKTHKIHQKAQAYRKQEKLEKQRIKDEEYVKKIEAQKKAKLQKMQAEKLRKKQHEILDKHGYVEGRKILAKKASMRPSLLSRIRRRVIGY